MTERNNIEEIRRNIANDPFRATCVKFLAMDYADQAAYLPPFAYNVVYSMGDTGALTFYPAYFLLTMAEERLGPMRHCTLPDGSTRALTDNEKAIWNEIAGIVTYALEMNSVYSYFWSFSRAERRVSGPAVVLWCTLRRLSLEIMESTKYGTLKPITPYENLYTHPPHLIDYPNNAHGRLPYYFLPFGHPGPIDMTKFDDCW